MLAVYNTNNNIWFVGLSYFMKKNNSEIVWAYILVKIFSLYMHIIY
jgi:hypothetical protein